MCERDAVEDAKERFLEVLRQIKEGGKLWPTLVGLLEEAGFPREAALDRDRSRLTTEVRIQKLPHYLTLALQELLKEGKIVIKLDSFFELPES